MIENHIVQVNADHDAEIKEEYLRDALDDVVDTVITCGQWPMPSTRPGCQRSPEFVLTDWIEENYDHKHMVALFSRFLSDFSNDFELERMRESDKLEVALREYFEGSDIVREHAEELMEDEK